MPTVRSSVPCAAADPCRAAAALYGGLLFASLIATGTAAAQQPVLRIGGAVSAAVDGADMGSAVFPARALETLGFRLAGDPAYLSAVLGTDTLRFWATSPFFRAGPRLHQLAWPVQFAGGSTHLPEQFFIQWLPAAYPDRFEYRAGELVVRTAPAGRAAARNTRVVVLDPGHGGRDPGKVGPNGLREKDVTLMVARRLEAILGERGYEVHLTRSTDTLVPLADRAGLANRWLDGRPIGVFLSIHANSATATSARGFETFFLSEARTEDERRVAEMENAAITFEDEPVVLTGNGLDQILNNLRSDFLLRASHDLASAVQEKLAAFHPGPNRGVKRAGFYVLVGAVMPAVLIETAFISNRNEADLLGTQAFQQKLAWGIADAVDEFFRRNEHLWVSQ